MHKKTLVQSTIQTPLGPLIAIADEQSLYFLLFADSPSLKNKISTLLQKNNATLINGTTAAMHSIEQELIAYFAGNLKTFKTPVFFTGTPFQQKTWQQLVTVPYGITQSYSALAKAVEKPSARRAVARANSTNNHIIIVPCHRIITMSGSLGGYTAGLDRKKWLLSHEGTEALQW